MRYLMMLIAVAILQTVLAQGTPDYLQIASGFSNPVVITHAGDGSNRLFIVEKGGVIKIIDLNTGEVLPDPFLNISPIVESSANEEGLLGLAFHPEYPDSGYFYVNYIFPEGSGPDSTRIARYEVSSDPNVADPMSEKTILKFGQPANNHNAGDMHFGADGYLYIAIGDGGDTGGTGSGFSQDVSNILGKILRIDIDGDDFPADNTKNYKIPSGNPYASKAGLDEIWHLGLRNPWKFSFDRMTGDMYIGDVGQSSREEIDFAANGVSDLNFGWKCREGDIAYGPGNCSGFFDDPIFVYNRTLGQSITGGHVYRGEVFENFKGWYFLADYGSDKLWQINSSNFSETNGPINATQVPTAFGESESGELYITAYGDGEIYRIIDRSVCPETANLTMVSDPINLAELTLSSTATLGGGEFSFYAGTSVDLENGFNVPSGTTFLADIGACGKP